MASKLTQVGSMLEPGGIFVFPITFCICDIVGEVYGYAYPRLFIWTGVLSEFLFSIVVTCVSHLPSPNFFVNAKAYQIVFDPTIRYVLSGFAGLLVGEFSNVYILAKFKILLNGKFYIFRSLFATALGQACLTIIVDVLNYSGKVSMHQLVNIMLSGYMWKMICALILVFPAWLIVTNLKRIENVDYYDIHTNFNPWIMNLDKGKTSTKTNNLF